MNIRVAQNSVSETGRVTESGKKVTISLPVRWYNTSERSGFNMYGNGKGTYFGPNQMFGGPSTGELVLFNSKTKPYIAIISGMSQDYVKRECTLEFLCYLSDFWKNVEKGLILAGVSGTINDNDIFKYTCETFSLDKAIDLSICVANERMKKHLASV